MKIISISYRVLENTGNYCSEALELEARIEDGDDLDECFSLLVAETKKKLKQAIAYKSKPETQDLELPY